MATMADALRSIETEPERRHIVSLSGGKDSTALALYIRQRYPQVPAEYVFCDTGCELPETYSYLDQLETLLGQQIHRLSALDSIGVARKHTRTAFDVWLREIFGGFLPSPQARWCTRVLKIEPFEAFIGNDCAFSYIGIRSDEERDGYTAKKPPVLSQKANIEPIYPFKDDTLELGDVQRILVESGIGYPDYYRWRTRSGCYFCFYQQIAEWQRLKQEHPDLFEQAKAYEKGPGGRQYSWVQGRTLAELEQISELYPLPAEDEAEGCAICHL